MNYKQLSDFLNQKYKNRGFGGVVYEDDRHISFVYENGELIYEEEK